MFNSSRPRAHTASVTPFADVLPVPAAEERQGVSVHAPGGTEQLRAVMALHQCDLFRGRRPVDYLDRSAEVIRCSVGPLSCTRRLRVDREYRVLLTAFGPKFVCKDIGSGAVAARRVGNVFLRYLKQTAGRMHMTMNRLKRDIPARSHAPRAPEDDVASGGGHRPQPRRVEVRDALGPSRLTAGRRRQ